VGALSCCASGVLTALASVQLPAGVARAHLGALESGAGAGLIAALGVLGAAGAIVLGPAPAQALSALAEPRANNAKRPSLS
jgi:hypothetical protein